MFKVGDGHFDFAWYDVYLGIVCNYTDIDYEMCSVLYNVGALHSILGSQETRASSEGMKVACTNFQCAAWSFHTIPDRFPQHTGGSDMSADLLAFLSQVCLAQAQECILEKSILDHRKPGIIAKVCAQVSEYYVAALRKIEASNRENKLETISESVGDKRSRAWIKYIDFKSQYYKAIAFLYLGIDAEESQKMGERVAYYNAASESLGKTTKMAKVIRNY